MKQLILIIGAAALVLLASCTKPLYKYNNYDEAAFKYAVAYDEKDVKSVAKSYKSMVGADRKKSKQKKDDKKKNTIPPGMCADYGYLLFLQKDTVKANAFFDKEIRLYPESKTYVTNLKKKLGI